MSKQAKQNKKGRAPSKKQQGPSRAQTSRSPPQPPRSQQRLRRALTPVQLSGTGPKPGSTRDVVRALSRKIQSVQAGRRPVVQAAVECVMNPIESPILRFALPSEINAVGTALARPYHTHSRTWLGATANPPYIPGPGKTLPIPLLEDDAKMPVVLLRDPVVRGVVREANPAQTDYKLNYAFNTSSLDRLFELNGNQQPTSIPIAGATPTGALQPYGAYHVSGENMNARVIWIDANPNAAALVNVIMGISEAPAEGLANCMYLTLWRHDGIDRRTSEWDAQFTEQNTTTLHAQATVHTSGYYELAVRFVSTQEHLVPADRTVVVESFETTISTHTTQVYKHILDAHVVDKRNLIDKVRVLGSSLLVSNTTPVVAQGGEVYALQTTGDEPWYQQFFREEIILETAATASYRGSWANGIYAFHKPSTIDSMLLHEAWTSVNGDLSIVGTDYNQPLSGFRPFRGEPVVVVLVSPPIGNMTENQAMIVIASSLEFTTRDQWLNLDTSLMSSGDWNEFVSTIRAADQFFENPLHWSKIRAFIKSALGKVVEYGPQVLHTAGILASLF